MPAQPPSLIEFCTAGLRARHEAHHYRALVPTRTLEGAMIERGGVRYINFGGNDYFGLSQHPEVVAAAGAALQINGAGGSALLSGYSLQAESLSHALAQAKGSEACVLFGSGYLANLGTITALVGKGDLILADKLAHACMIDAAQLSGATLRRFAHQDLVHLERLLAQRQDYRHCLIVTETVFSMDGDRTDLAAMRKLADAHDCWLLSDDAHGLGVMDDAAAHLRLGTLSKGLGAYGGYVCAPQAVCDWLINTARSLIFSTALPPSVLAGAQRALELLYSDAALRTRPLHHAQRVAAALGIADAQSPILPLILGDAEAALAASQKLAEAGFWVPAIRPPTVPQGRARLRFSFSALHTGTQINRLTEALHTHGITPHSHL